jgi:hypothetical protein
MGKDKKKHGKSQISIPLSAKKSFRREKRHTPRSGARRALYGVAAMKYAL